MPRIHAYLRVSKDHQEQTSQRQQIDQWATATGQPVAVWWTDKETSATPWQSRQIAAALQDARPEDTLVVSEISRIARSVIGVLTFLQEAAAQKVTVHIVRERLTLDASLHSQIMVTVLALAAQIERELCRSRTKAAMQARKNRGLPVGRQPGTRVRSKLDAHRAEILTLLEKKVSKRAITRIVGCSPQSLYNWLKRPSASTVDDRTLPLPGIEPLPQLIGTSSHAATINP